MKYLLPFDCLMDLPSIYIYDDEDFKLKYPNGFVTKRFIAIPADIVNQIKQFQEEESEYQKIKLISKSVRTKDQENFLFYFKQFRKKDYEKADLISYMFNESFIAFLEHHLNFNLTLEERETIYKYESLGTTSKNIDKLRSLNLLKFDKISDEELLSLIKGKNYVLEDYINIQPFRYDGSLVRRLKENHQIIRDLPSLEKAIEAASGVINNEEQAINDSVSLEEFKKIARGALIGTFDLGLPLEIVIKKINQEFKVNKQENVIEKLNNHLLDLMFNLGEIQFKTAINLLVKNLQEVIPTSDWSKDLRFKFSEKLITNPHCTRDQRNHIMNSLCKVDDLVTDLNLDFFHLKRKTG